MDKKLQGDLEKEIYKDIKNRIKKILSISGFAILCLLVAGFFVFSLNFRLRAQATGGMIGQETGRAVGKAVGSFDGLTRGQFEGNKAGKAEGLSAKDTTAELAGKIKEIEKLEVLVASGTFSDILSIGTDYAALLAMKYNAVFSVDLSTADIELGDDGLHITLNEPTVEFIPVGEIEKKNEYQKKGFIAKPGSAEDGYDALNNSANQIRKKATEQLQEDDSLMKAARASTMTQMTQLVNAVSISKPPVFINFREVN